MEQTEADELGSVDINGPLHVEHLTHGWYAIGKGMLIPCRDRDEAEAVVEDMKTNGNEPPVP
jgi:hypothetical protein